MARCVKDLRELICISRLSYRTSDEDDVTSSDDGFCLDCSQLSLRESDCCYSSKPLNNARVASPDSGCYLTTPYGETNAKKNNGVLPNIASVSDQLSQDARKNRKQQICEVPTGFLLPKPPTLPPIGKNVTNESKASQPAAIYEPVMKRNCFDDVFGFLDATVVASWLDRANQIIPQLNKFCSIMDNFVNIAHFWLSEIPVLQKKELLELEYSILHEELSFAFVGGKDLQTVTHRDIQQLLAAVYREYPCRLISSRGSHMFLDYLDILSSERKADFKKLLSDVKCSTANKQYAQWLLAIRAFALLNVWFAVVNFYCKLKEVNISGLPNVPEDLHQNVYYQRVNQAIRLGYVDVVHYHIVTNRVDPTVTDDQGRSLLFSAIMHNQPEVVHFLVCKVRAIDVNGASGTGNSPLHAATNGGNLSLVTELLCSPDINVNCVNSQCDNATPLHLAAIHGNTDIVKALLQAKADTTAKMGNMTPVDIARDFGHDEVLQILCNLPSS